MSTLLCSSITSTSEMTVTATATNTATELGLHLEDAVFRILRPTGPRHVFATRNRARLFDDIQQGIIIDV